MPVAVDRTHDMGVFVDKGTVGDVQAQDIAQVDSPKKVKMRKPKRTERQQQPVAGSSSEQAADDGTTWAWRSLTESSASRVTPVFTKDGSYFMTAAGASVKIYSVATGHVVSTLSPANTSSKPAVDTGYGDAITSMILSPHNAFQLFTSSLDGCIRVWDFVDAVLLQTVDTSLPILCLTAHEKFKNEVCVALSKKTKKLNHHRNATGEDNAVVFRVSLIPTNATARLPVQQSSSIKQVGKTRATAGLAYSPSGAWLVAIGGHKAYVSRTSDTQSGFTKLVSPDKLTCLTFHPTEEYFATGDSRGVVRLWYCLNDSLPSGVSGVEKKAPTTTLHWHAHAVASLAFTANGAYLLSGGEEAVLVIWQLHTGKKEFVPRVGAPIASVALSTSKSSEEEYLVGLADASFVFVRSGTLRISRTIARVKLDPAISHNRPSGSTAVPLAAHSISSSLVLPSSHPSSLQIYSPLTSKLLSELEVSPSNRISRRDEKALEPCRVEFTAVSDSGEWMATVDSREAQDEFRGEVYLKIWSWDRKSSSWLLNTRIDRPHGLSKITAIAFRPRVKDNSLLYLVTTAEDGHIKLWGIRTTTSKAGEVESYWITRSIVRFRTEIPSHASWSQDGSLLAVSLGPYVVLYDPNTLLVLKTLTCPECSTVVSSHFIGRSGRYLAIKGRSDLVLWDLITDSVRWHYQSPSAISHVFSHPREESFVIFETDTRANRTKISKLTPASASPTSSHSLPFRLHSVATCPAKWLMSNEPASFAFVGITHAWTAVIFGDHIHLTDADQAEAKGLIDSAPVTRRTLFQDIFGKSAFADLTTKHVAPAALSGATPWKGKQVEGIFNTPAYLMPPLGTLFDTLMDEFLKPRPEEQAEELVEHEPLDEDVEMEEGGAEVPIVVGNRLERIVDRQEMEAMINLFQNHCLQPVAANAPASKAKPQVNGYHKYTGPVNGTTAPAPVAAPHINGTPGTAKTHPKSTSISVQTPEPTQSPAVKAGQKRKKSIG